MCISSKLSKESQAVLTAAHKLIGNGYEVPFIKLLLVDVGDVTPSRRVESQRRDVIKPRPQALPHARC